MSRTMAALAAAAAMLVAMPAAAHADVTFTAKGRWTCNNRGTVTPIAGARVEFWQDISFWPDDKVGATHTAADGSYRFDVRAGGNFDLYTKLVLNDDAGVTLGDWYSFSDWNTDTDTTGSHAGTVDLGTWQVSRDGGSGTPKCAVWQGAHNAYQNFRAVTRLQPPDSQYSISADFPCCGVPFTTTDTTRWPSGYPTGGGYSTNFHEFAHSVRHSYDGGTAHFLFDAARFGYPRSHNLCSNTNPGFAFNEGWAEYWARTVATCPPSPTDYSDEGNVASALTSLEKCAGRAAMVRVLRESPGAIHSFDEFQSRFTAVLGPRPCLLGTIVTGTIGVENTQSVQQQTAGLQAQIAAQQKLIGRLARQRGPATRRARRPGACPRARRCQTAVERLIAPGALDAQIAQAKLVLGRLRGGLAAVQKAGFQPTTALTDALQASRRSFDRDNQAIVIKGLKASAHAIDANGAAAATKAPAATRLDQRLTLLTRARKRGNGTPSQVASLFSAPSPPVDVASRRR
jgi:hypothetical protein